MFKMFNYSSVPSGIITTIILVALAMLLILSVSNFFQKSYSGSDASDYFDKSFIKTSQAYHSTRLAVYILKQVILWIFILSVFIFAWKYFSRNPNPSFWMAVLYIFIFFIILYLIQVPFDYYRGFLLEQKYNLSNYTSSAWFIDYLKSAGISIGISIASFSIIYLLISRVPAHWWWITAVLLIIFIIMGTLLVPVIIDPLFYNFEPLEDGELNSGIVQIAGEAGIKVDKVLVADASKKTKKANAYFTGLGPTKRIVIYDNLLEKFENEEILAVVAHEAGHWKYNHILKTIAIVSAGIIAVSLFLNFIIKRLGCLNDFRSIVLIFLLFTFLSFIIMPAENYISRFFEKQADRTAVELTGDPDTQIRLIVELAKSNLSDVSPNEVVKLMLYSHPPIVERIKSAENMK